MPWALVLAGVAVGALLVRVEARQPEPLIDVPVLTAPVQWPVQATAFLSGMSVLGAQVPLSTFARAVPAAGRRTPRGGGGRGPCRPRTGFAAGMTNGSTTVGGAIASAVFAVALASTGSIDHPTTGAAPLSGYLTVWAVCAAAAALAAVLLLVPARRRPGTESVPGLRGASGQSR